MMFGKMYVVDKTSGQLKHLPMEAFPTDAEFLDALYLCWTGKKRECHRPTMLQQLGPIVDARSGRGSRPQHLGTERRKRRWQQR